VKQDCDKGQTRKQLQRLADKVDCVFLWLDNDREGENISFEILATIFSKMKK
jgi:DNA topoisomerase IA